MQDLRVQSCNVRLPLVIRGKLGVFRNIEKPKPLKKVPQARFRPL
jgi:hypothetical protein